MPDLLTRSTPWVRSVFDHAWAPMQALARQIQALPPELFEYLTGWDTGFVFISTGESRYLPGPATIRDQSVQNVAFVSVEDLAGGNERPLHTIGHLIDHHLGCGGSPDGLWLSQGGGTTSNLQQASIRLPRLFDLGYGVDEIAQANVRDYFAQSLAVYCQDRQRLNVADPQIYKWFRSTLWNEPFWRTGE